MVSFVILVLLILDFLFYIYFQIFLTWFLLFVFFFDFNWSCFSNTLRSRKNAPPPVIFFEKKIRPPPLLLGPPLPLLIFGFSSLVPKAFEQCKTYLSIRNSIKSNEIYFFECFCFQCYF